jgi:hypothetical protein
MLRSVLAAMGVAVGAAALAPCALAAESGRITNPCIAHAVETPGLYASLEAMSRACGLPTSAHTTVPPPVPVEAPRGAGAPPPPTPCDYCEYYIYSGDSENVINAKGCSTNTDLITYPVSSGCEEGKDERWVITALSSGYRALIALYHETLVCMIAGPEGGDNAGAQPCTQPAESDMEFRRPEVSESCYSGWYYIVPASNYSLTLNVKGGLGEGRNIISYAKGCSTNNVWYYEPA